MIIINAPTVVPSGTGNSCTEHAPTERKDEQVIENDIQDGSYYIAHHGKVR